MEPLTNTQYNVMISNFYDYMILVVCLEIVSMFIDNKNFRNYKGALYENIVTEMLTKAGCELYFYRNEKKFFLFVYLW